MLVRGMVYLHHVVPETWVSLPGWTGRVFTARGTNFLDQNVKEVKTAREAWPHSY